MRNVLGNPDLLAYTPRRAELTAGFTVSRLLPQRQRRLVGPWCFLDHFAAGDLEGRRGLDVAPHPHTGLQTVTWMVEGEVLHRDSLGNEQSILPGQLNLMTAGNGIAHSEESPPEHPPRLHGLQLWTALAEASRNVAPSFEHHAILPPPSSTRPRPRSSSVSSPAPARRRGRTRRSWEPRSSPTAADHCASPSSRRSSTPCSSSPEALPWEP